jgi:hypothetical protein
MSVTGFGGGGKGGRRGRNGDLLKPEINQVWGNLQIRKCGIFYLWILEILLSSGKIFSFLVNS